MRAGTAIGRGDGSGLEDNHSFDQSRLTAASVVAHTVESILSHTASVDGVLHMWCLEVLHVATG